MQTILCRFSLWSKPPMHFGLGFVYGVFLTKFGSSRHEKKISAGGRNFGPRPKSLLKAGILSHLPKKSILSGGPSRRQLYPSRWYRFFFFKKKAVAYRSLNL